MELTYHDIIKADFSALTTTAKEWRTMATGCGRVQDDYRDHVRGRVRGWTGESANSFWISSSTTLYELGAARSQANRIADLLDDAHDRLVEARNHLKSVRDAAVEEGGIKVDEYGKCTLDTSKLTAAHTDALPDAPTRTHAEATWTHRIQKAVQHVDDTDHDNMLALKAAARDTDGKGATNGFNGRAIGDVETYAAHRAADLATRLAGGADGGSLSPKERHELQVLMRSNADDKQFSQTFLNSLGGPRGTIKLANTLTMLKLAPAETAAPQYTGLEKSLATTLASATRVPRIFGKDHEKLPLGSKAYSKRYVAWLNSPEGAFYKSWRQNMQHIGPAEWTRALSPAGTAGLHERKGHGYQSLVTLMRHGDGYSAQMLHDLGDDIRAAEEKDPDIWDDGGHFPGTADFATDPYDGVLDLMSKNPETAAGYLDPKSDSYTVDGKITEDNDRLKYLAQDRDWRLVDDVTPPMTDADKTSDSVHEGFEAALKAGATGRLPDSDSATAPPNHSAANSRVMEETVDVFGGEPKRIEKDGPLANMRDSLGEITADYTGDVQRGVSGFLGLPSHGHQADFKDTSSLERFLATVGRDPHAYGAITTAQHAYTSNHVDHVINGGSDSKVALEERVANAVRPGATVAGIMSDAKAEGVYGEEIAEQKEYNEKAARASKWVNRFVGLGLGAPGAPPVAAPIGWVQEDFNEAIVKMIEKDNTEDASRRAIHDYSEGKAATEEFAKAAVRNAVPSDHPDIDRETRMDLMNSAVAGAASGHTTGGTWNQAADRPGE
ncbi:DUF6571 family protein [Streptomyces sp. NPDC048172]|uniref:DUF6571 family protein n=1 Tax=Streptomyces sp. NPDC048172 TaxID=3365505 RepID=UPI003713A7CF